MVPEALSNPKYFDFFDALNRIVHHEKLQHVVKILETPWVDGVAPYKHEIAMLKAGIFDQEIMTKLKNQE